MPEFSAKSIKFTRVGYISFEDFMSTLQNNNEDRELYFQVKQKLMMNEYPQVCDLCHRSHELSKCTFAFYSPSPRKVHRRA
jgi:hypothetical protein